MLLARIITCRAGDAADLAAQLRASGYMVETVNPGDRWLTPADLEIELESCPAEEALARAAQRAEQIQADKIIVAAGALAGAQAPSDVAVSADELGDSRSADAGVRSPWRALISRWEHWWRQLLARESVPSVQANDESGPEVFPGRSELRTAHDVSSAADGVPAVDETPGSELPAETPDERASTMEIEPILASDAPADVARRQEPGAVADRQPPAAPEAGLVPSIEPAPTSAVSPPKQRTQPVQYRRPYARLRQREREWRVAVAVAAVFAILLALGWSAASHPRPAAPLSNAELNHGTNIEQQVPFGPVTVHPAVPAAKAPAASPAQAATAPSAAPVNTPHKPDAVVIAHTGRKRASRGSRRTGGEDEEVIVRHFTAQPPKAPATSTSQLKRYSDLQ